MPEDVRARFGPVAANYANAKFHSSAEGLREMLELARPQRADLALDVATGAGHVALALAPQVRRVYGLDPSHVLSMTVDEWVELLEHAGFEVDTATARELDWDFEDWMRNMAVPIPLVAELAQVVEAAEGKAREQLHPERRDGKLHHAY